MFQKFVIRAALAASALAMAACAQAPRETNPRLSDPLPPPAPVTQAAPQAPVQAAPQAGAQDIVLRGAAYAVSGDGRFPPNSQMTVRVYDAAVGDVNQWVAEQSFTRSGGLPWPYSMNFRSEALRGVSQPALAARIEGPRGELIYQTEQAVALVPGKAEDIPMSFVGGGVGIAPAANPAQSYVGASVQREVPTRYGIPDDRAAYGTQNYDASVYPGQSYQPSTLSGPPSNGVF